MPSTGHLQLGPIELSNRIAVSPMCQNSATDGCATDWHTIHLGRLGMSGAALVMVEATAVERRGRISQGCLGLYDDDCEVALLHTLARVRRVAGPTRYGIQLAHAGRKASTHIPWQGGRLLQAGEDPWGTVSASASAYDDRWHVPEALDEAGMARARTGCVFPCRLSPPYARWYRRTLRSACASRLRTGSRAAGTSTTPWCLRAPLGRSASTGSACRAAASARSRR